MLLFHHARSVAGVRFGEIAGSPEHADHDFLGAYYWLAKQVGFWPIFIAVGCRRLDIYMTGYQDNWMAYYPAKIFRNGRFIGVRRKTGDFENNILFSFGNLSGVFMDYHLWSMLMYKFWRVRDLTNYEKRLIFKPSWPRSRWIRYAKRNPHSVQLVVPRIDLSLAERIWVRNRATKSDLEAIGFACPQIKRIPLRFGT